MKRTMGLWLLCVLMLSFPMMGCEKVNERRARRITNRAVKFFKEDQFSTARRLLKDALVLNPNDANARYLLGRVFESLQQPSEAVQEYERAAYLKTSDYRPHFNLGGIYFKSKRYAKAVVHYEKVVALKSDHVYALYHLGLSLHKLRKYQQAETMFSKVIAVKSKFVQAYNGLAYALLDQAEQAQLQSGVAQAAPLFLKAESALKKAIALGVATPQTHNILGLAYQKQKKFDAAVASFKVAMKKLSEAAHNLGATYDVWLEELLTQAKQEKDATKRLEIMKDADIKRGFAMDAFKEYLQLSRSDQAIRHQIRTKIHKLKKMVFEDSWKDLINPRKRRRRRRR